MYVYAIFSVLFVPLCTLSAASSTDVELVDPVSVTLNVNSESGEFEVYIEGKHWFSSGPVFFRANNELYSTADNNLALVSCSDSADAAGTDIMGSYDKIEIRYENNKGQVMVAAIKIYESAIVFDQSFPSGLQV